MISGMKRITVHGQGTVYYLTAFKIDGEYDDSKPKEVAFEASDKVLAKAGYRSQYIAVIRWAEDPNFKIFIDNVGATYAPHSTQSGCPVLNAAVAHIYQNFDRMYPETHIEVEDDPEKNFDELDLTVTPGLQFK